MNTTLLPLAGRPINAEDVREVLELLQATTRKPHQCISKGQLKELAEQMIAKHTVLQRRFQETSEDSRRLAWMVAEGCVVRKADGVYYVAEGPDTFTPEVSDVHEDWRAAIDDAKKRASL